MSKLIDKGKKMRPGHEVRGYVMTGYIWHEGWLHKQIRKTNKHRSILHNKKQEPNKSVTKSVLV
jgi:hypothetical protein